MWQWGWGLWGGWRLLSPWPVPHALLILFLLLPQRQKSTYTAHPKAEPTPMASSAPPAGGLYSSPVVSLFHQADFSFSRDYDRGLLTQSFVVV